MPRLMHTDARRRARAGFSLVESLITIMILGIVGVALTRVMVKQQQSYRDTSNQANMQREIRLTSSMLPAELRSMSSSGADIIEMGEDHVTFLANIGSGIICGKIGNTHIMLTPLLSANITTTNWYSQPVAGDTVFLYNDSLSTGAEDDVWERRPVANLTSNTTDCPGAPYTDPVLDAGKYRWRIGVAGLGVPDSVRLGAVARFARPVRYSIYQETSGRWYIGYQEYVGGAWTTAEPVGGPYKRFIAGDANPSGLQFRYYDSLGTRLTSTAQALDVARIDAFLRTDAGLAAVTERRPRTLQDSVMMRIAVRNFK
ncbi:MAG TPA: prepilin-type N-terminal cleavage/methylation domain-containing protein [Gemmatimonadaceae bacterium]|nr:prepilin-type N-terminal cleavage/methylation domain-containing protein [Gemmatimonadaceae bacterium]